MTHNKYINITEDRRQLFLNRYDKPNVQDVTTFCIVKKMTLNVSKSTFYTFCPTNSPFSYGIMQLFQVFGISEADALNWFGKSDLSVAREHGLPVGFWNWNAVNDFVTKFNFLIEDMAAGKFPEKQTMSELKHIEIDLENMDVQITFPDTRRHVEMKIVDIPLPNKPHRYNYKAYAFRLSGASERISPFLPFEEAGIPDRETWRLMRENKVRMHNSRGRKTWGFDNKLEYAIRALEILDKELDKRETGKEMDRQHRLAGHVQLEFE